MSTTIGLGYTAENNADLFSEIEFVAHKFGYGLLRGIEYAESDVQAGLKIAQKNEGWENLLFLQSPHDGNVALSFGIHEELTAYELTGERPRFFEFLNQLEILCVEKCKKLSIFFASEWSEQDRIRYSYGKVNDLISLLSMPGHWCLRYLIPETGRLQDSDEVPLIFDLKLK